MVLSTISTPADIRALDEEQLPKLCDQVRQALIDIVSGCGGHFASGLGTVELTVALHYVFDTPNDPLIWDVGHQAYPHKILTGRKDKLHTIRQSEGLHPFPAREESEYDAFGVGHSSTSISAALGYAMAAKKRGKKISPVAVIGDGALTAGMAFEALNHAGHVHADMLVVLNDNDMSISENVGALSSYLVRIISSKLYTNFRDGSRKILNNMPAMQAFAKKAEEHIKGMVVPGTLFEELGFNYIGPVDGHDVLGLVKTLRNMKDFEGPQFLHIITQKGKGFSPAESDPIGFHGVSAFNPDSPDLSKSPSHHKTYSQIFGDFLCDIGENEDVMAITPAMREGSGMTEFASRYPDKFVDVGIAEQHAVTLAAGMACEDVHPIVAIYSTFLQRAYDQLIHDVALQNLPVTFAIDRAGIVGGDGATHQGCFDLSYLRQVPNMVVMAPSDENECRKMLYTAYKHQGPTAVRYPRGKGPGAVVEKELKTLPIGKGHVTLTGKKVAILSFGACLAQSMEAAKEIGATVIDMRFIKPLDNALILEMALEHELIVTIEENVITGGAGSAVLECISQAGLALPVVQLGFPDKFIPHGDPEKIMAAMQLDKAGILNKIERAQEQLLGSPKKAS